MEYKIVQRVRNKGFINRFLWKKFLPDVFLLLSFKPSEEDLDLDHSEIVKNVAYIGGTKMADA